MAKTPREVALEVIVHVNKHDSYANILLPKRLQESQFDTRDKAFITELTYGTLRARDTLDWIIKQHSTQRFNKIPPAVLDLLRMSVYQIMYMDVPDHAAVNESVELAKRRFHPGIAKFVNGMLRNIVRNKDSLPWPSKENDPAFYLSLKYFHPLWMVKVWLDEFGFEQTEALCNANNQPPKLTIRVNTLKTTPESLQAVLRKQGIEVESGLYVPEALSIKGAGDLTALPQYKDGLFYVQDESSMLIAHVLDPKPGETIVDAAAAPGGKATHIAELMQDKGQVIAADSNQNRISLMKQNLQRLGISIALPLHADATKLKSAIKQPVDRLLLDGPCSGLGVLARRPDSRWNKNFQQIIDLQTIQSDMLAGVADIVRPGGVLVYSVCTMTREETRIVVDRLLKARDDYYMDDITPYLPEQLVPDAKDGFIQLLPHKHGVDGLFIARLRRAG